jgi:16S rRNA (cytosine1402-N4)-methyltransferase
LGISQDLIKQGKQFDLILADLGVSSPHLNTASRGFSFDLEGPLDMRMDQRQSLSAEQVVNGYSEKHLSTLIRTFGEEPKAKKIARAIVRNRPVKTTKELAKIVTEVVRRKGKAHPATKTFQALRVEVNSELEQLTKALPLWLELLKPGGRMAVISFHSLEDRLVKKAFKEAGGK